jgi:hypothetical protein
VTVTINWVNFLSQSSSPHLLTPLPLLASSKHQSTFPSQPARWPSGLRRVTQAKASILVVNNRLGSNPSLVRATSFAHPEWKIRSYLHLAHVDNFAIRPRICATDQISRTFAHISSRLTRALELSSLRSSRIHSPDRRNFWSHDSCRVLDLGRRLHRCRSCAEGREETWNWVMCKFKISVHCSVIRYLALETQRSSTAPS